jgi:hypothetical protein
MRAVVIGLGTFARVHEYAGLPAKWGFARTRVRVAHDSAPCAFKTGAERRSGWRMRWSGSSSTTIRAQCDGVAAHVSAPWSSLAGLNVVVHAHRDHQDRIREPRFRWKSTSPRHDASPRAAGTTRRRGGGGLLSRYCAQPGLRAATALEAHGAESRATQTHRTGEAPFGGQTRIIMYPWQTFRDRSRLHAWAKPYVAARTYTLTHRSTGSESDHEPTHGRSPVWRADPRRSYERSLPSSTPRVAARLGWSFLITP